MASLSNINGLFDVHSTGAILFSTSHGTSGQILRSNGNAAPTWVAASTVIGGPYLPLTGGTLSGATATATGINFTVGGDLTVAGIVGMGSTGIYAGTAAQLNLPGRGLAIKNDKNGSNNNWSYIENTATGSASNINFYTGNNAAALTLAHNGDATFTGSVTAVSASIPTMSVNTNFVGSIYQVGSLFKTNNYINIAGGKYVKKYLLSEYFTNGDANQAVNIYFPNVAIQGYLRITLSGTYSHQNITGKLTKVIPFGWNPNNSIWGPGSNYTIETAVGGVADNFTIGNIAWRSASSQYYIPVYKLSTNGNSVKVIVEYFGDGGSQIDNLALGGKYTISPPAPFNNRHYPSVERLQIGSGGYTGGVQYGIRLPQGTTDDSKIGWADNAGSERAAIICDSSTDSLHFYTGNSGTLSDRVRITAGGVLDVDGPGAKIKVDGANYVEMATFAAGSGSTAGIVQNNSGYVTSFSTSGTHQNSNTALFVPVANGIKITKPGLLQVSVTQDFISTLSSGYAAVQIRKNGSVIFFALRTNSNGQWDTLSSTGTMIVAANDEIQFYYAATDFTSMDTGSWSQYSFIWTSR